MNRVELLIGGLLVAVAVLSLLVVGGAQSRRPCGAGAIGEGLSQGRAPGPRSGPVFAQPAATAPART